MTSDEFAVAFNATFNQQLSAEEVDRLVAGFQYLTDLEFVDSERAGLAGFCIGASLAFVAAADPRIADEVSFINFFGGYYNAVDLMAQVSSKQRFYENTIEHWAPSRLSRKVFRDHLIALVPHTQERELLQRTFVGGDDIGGFGAAFNWDLFHNSFQSPTHVF